MSAHTHARSSRPERAGGAAAPLVPSAAEVQERLLVAPFHQWLGLTVTEVHRDRIEISAAPRPEWVGDPATGYLHGGILASLLDLGADWALVGTIGRAVPTIDLTVHYLRAARLGPLHVTGRLVRPGRQVSTAEAEVRDDDGRSLALARGSFLSAVADAGNAG